MSTAIAKKWEIASTSSSEAFEYMDKVVAKEMKNLYAAFGKSTSTPRVQSDFPPKKMTVKRKKSTA